MYILRPVWMLLLVGSITLPACATAQQTNSDSVQETNQCRLAAQILRTGNPDPHAEWAYERIRRCGSEGGAAVAASILASRHLTDVATLERITTATLYLVDEQIFDAALKVAEDRTATKEARVFAFRTLILTLSPGRVLRYDQLSKDDCFGLPPSLHHEVAGGAPLASDYRERIRLTAGRVAADTSAPHEVVRAAACTSLYLLE